MLLHVPNPKQYNRLVVWSQCVCTLNRLECFMSTDELEMLCNTSDLVMSMNACMLTWQYITFDNCCYFIDI